MELAVVSPYQGMLLEIAAAYEHYVVWWTRMDLTEEVRAILRKDLYWYDMGDKKLDEYMQPGWWALPYDWKANEAAPQRLGVHDMDVYEYLEREYHQEVWEWVETEIQDLDAGGCDVMYCGTSIAGYVRELWKVMNTHVWESRPKSGPQKERLHRLLHGPHPAYAAG